MKVRGGRPSTTALRRLRGDVHVVETAKYGVVARTWPRKRGPSGTPAQLAAREQFSNVIQWMSEPLPQDVEAAQFITKNTLYLNRDAMMAACYGTIMEAYCTDGTVLRGVRIVAGDIQAMLDTITNTVGDFLLRTENGWVGVPAGSGGLAGNAIGWASSLAPPTKATTDFTIGMGVGAAITDTAAGILVNATGGSFGARTNLALTPPYTITALVSAFGAGGNPGFGWTDGTKIQWMFCANSGTSPTNHTFVNNNSSVTTFASTAVDAGILNQHPGQAWYQIRDDGTSVYFRASNDGVNFKQIFTTTKAAGYLGSTGYSHLFIGTPGSGGTPQVTLESFART